VGIDALLAALGLGWQAADEVLQRAHGADPAAEEAAQEERRHKDNQAPQQTAIESVAAERVDKGRQRVPLEEQAHRGEEANLLGSAGIEAQSGEVQQPQKEEQKEDFRNSTQQRQPGMGHNTPPPAACAG